jgi:acetoin utilization protein AcuB
MNPNALLSDIMTPMPLTISPETNLTDIYKIFETNSFHHIPVVDQGKLVGMISREDFVQIEHVLTTNWSGNLHADGTFENFHARDIMTEYPMHLGPDDTIGLAADIVLTNKFHALPIIEDDMLVGIVTAHDLIAFAFSSPVERTTLQ